MNMYTRNIIVNGARVKIGNHWYRVLTITNKHGQVVKQIVRAPQYMGAS